MTARVECPACGKQSEIGRIFCRHCGARLNLAQVRVARPRVRRTWGVGRWVRIAVLLGLVALAGAILWPVEPAGAVGGPRDGEALRAKILEVELARQRGRRIAQRASEEEINAYLEAVVRHTAAVAKAGEPGAGPWMMEVKRVRMDLRREDVAVGMVAGWGPLELTYELVLVPSVNEEGLRWGVREARVGRLPLRGWWKDRVSGRVARAFSKLDRERAVLEAATAVDLEEGAVRLSW